MIESEPSVSLDYIPIAQRVVTARGLSGSKLSLAVSSCANPPVELKDCRIYRSYPKMWMFTGEVAIYRGDKYGKILLIANRLNIGAGNGKWVRLSDMDGRISRVVLREVTL